MKNKYVLVLALCLGLMSAQVAKAQCTSSIQYLQQTICGGTTYSFQGMTLDTAGTYNDTIVIAGGCDSIISLQLFVTPILYTNFYDTICQGGSYSFGGHTLTTAGIYGDTLYYGSSFCDSIVLLHLAVTPAHNDTIRYSATYCTTAPGAGGGPQGYNFFGTRETASGTYVYHGGTIPGGGTCADSVVILDLSVGAATVIIGTRQGGGPGGGTIIPDTIRTCSSSYDLYGNVETATGDYTDSILSSLGCDSIKYYIYLILNSGYNTAIVNGTACNGQPFIWRGNSYPAGGGGFGATTYYDTITVAGGCDTIYSIVVTPGFGGPPVAVSDSFCAGSTFTYYDSTFTTSGAKTVVVQSATGGCPTTYDLTLTYKVAPIYTWVDSFCDGSTYTYRGHTYTDSGTHAFTEPAPGGGCDSIIKVVLSYKSAPTIALVDSFCQGSSFTFRDSVYTTSGLHGYTVSAPTGCDSIFNLTLNYTVEPRRTIAASTCQGVPYIYGTDTFTTQGFHRFNYAPGAGQCDSLLTINLTVTPAPTLTVADSFCQGGMLIYAGDTFTASGTFTASLPAATGCDTIVTLNLTYKAGPGTPVISQSGTNLIENPIAADIQWYLNGSPIGGATSQIYTPTQDGIYTVTTALSATSCTATSAPDTVTIGGISTLDGQDQFKIYPNPNNGKFTIETALYQGSEVVVYDVLGRAVYQAALLSSKQAIDMSATNAGTYYMVIKNEQLNRYTHFVITH